MAAETLPFLKSRSVVRGREAPGRLRSTETDLLEAKEGAFGKGVVEVLGSEGEGNLLEEEEDDESEDELEVEEEEAEGDMYLEDTILDLGLLGLPETPLLLSFSEGSNGGLRVLGFWGSVVEAAPETAATIITIQEADTYTHTRTVIREIAALTF